MTLTESAAYTGRAPGGMWWVAWRQHRVQLAIAVGLMAIGAAVMVIFRINLVADLMAAGCEGTLRSQMACVLPNGQEFWYSTDNNYRFWYTLITAAGFGVPLVLGVFLGAAIFPREFEQGTHVYALSQSMSRVRWWAAKVTVVGAPLVLGLLALGLLKAWLDTSNTYTAFRGMSTEPFSTRSIIPAAIGLAVFAAAVAAGIFTRRTVVALVVSLIVGLGMLAALAALPRAHLVPADRYPAPIPDVSSGTSYTADPTFGDRDALYVGGGYLDGDGNAVSWNQVTGMGCSTGTAWDATKSDQENMDASQQAWNDCLTDHGIVSTYNDIVPGTMLWPLRLISTGIFLALSVLLLAAGAWRLRAAVAKR